MSDIVGVGRECLIREGQEVSRTSVSEVELDFRYGSIHIGRRRSSLNETMWPTFVSIGATMSPL